MTTPFITTGVQASSGPNDSIPIRREIRELQQNSPLQWNLLLLGLRALQTVDESTETSFYQISGIHGLPYKAWNGVQGISGQDTGYCTHSSILFLPWHRPYLALFEQVLYEQVQKVANAFIPSLRSQYVSAAQDFRLPYWDWGVAVGGNVFPNSVAGPVKVQVTGIDGNLQTIPNPLYQYNFDEKLISADFPDPPFNVWTATLRYPQNTSAKASSRDDLVGAALNSQIRNIKSMIRYIMGSITEFGPFSNDIWIPGQPGAYASLEDIHDNIHVLVGGPGPTGRPTPPGNMSIIPYAAFDPVFWLHHCNVDRLFAIWQAINPSSYVEPEPAPAGGTFTRAAGTIEDVEADLTPFWLSSSSFHTSQTARTTNSLGYAYPETQGWNFPTTALYQQSIRRAITKLYGTTVFSSNAISLPSMQDLKAAAGFRQAEGEVGVAPIAERNHIKRDTSAPSPKQKVATDVIEVSQKDQQAITQPLNTGNQFFPGSKYKEWITNIRAQKHGSGGAFQVHIFLGDVPTDIHSWLVGEENVGTFSVLSSDAATTNCQKCKADAEDGLIVTGVIPLTEALLGAIEHGELPSLESEHVVPYLTKKLHWRVTQHDGTEKQRDDVEDLQVSVVSTDVTIPASDDEFATYSGVYTIHPECTQGRPAGYNDGDNY